MSAIPHFCNRTSLLWALPNSGPADASYERKCPLLICVWSKRFKWKGLKSDREPRKVSEMYRHGSLFLKNFLLVCKLSSALILHICVSCPIHLYKGQCDHCTQAKVARRQVAQA